MKMIRNKKNKNLDISADRAAIEGNPSTPAMIAMIKKMNAHFNIFTPSVVRREMKKNFYRELTDYSHKLKFL